MKSAKVTPENYSSEDDEISDGLFKFLRIKFDNIENEVLKWIEIEEKNLIAKRYKDTSHIIFKDQSKSNEINSKTISSYSINERDAGYLIIGNTVTQSLISREYNKKKSSSSSITKGSTIQSQSAFFKKIPELESSDKTHIESQGGLKPLRQNPENIFASNEQSSTSTKRNRKCIVA